MGTLRKGTNSKLSLLRLVGRFARDQRGNVAAAVGILIIPLVGVLALAGEISGWYTVDRTLQNATDAAAIAAARNNDQTNDAGGMARYQREAFAVATQYGYVNGVNNVTVTATTSACPGGANTGCYQVTISRPEPVLLSRVVGFVGNTTLNGGAAKTIAAKSIATTAAVPTVFCIITLGGGGITSPLLVNGGPKTDLNGCSTLSNDNATCNGQPIGNIGYSYAVGTSDCAPAGFNKTLGAPITNPYASLAAFIPPPSNDNCNPSATAAGYPQEGSGGFKSYSGPSTISPNAIQYWCGDLQLTSNLTLSSGSELVIENGILDANSFTVTSNGGTIIFTGPAISGFSPGHYITDNSNPGKGTFNLTAPTQGNFANIVVYQDPALPAGADVNMTAAGKLQTWIINGLIVAPNADIQISGAMNSGVTDCFGLVASSLRINGGGSIANDAGCGPITIPGLTGGNNVALVQ